MKNPSVQSVRDVLGRSHFGLTAEEIASKAGLSEASVRRFLDALISEKKAKKTKAGSNYFYSFMKILVVLSFIAAFGIAQAQEMNSTNFKALPVMASAGGDSSGVTLKLAVKAGQPVSGESTSVSFSLCAGFVCDFIQAIINAKITFLLEFNISGSSNDAAYVDNETALAQYRSNQISNYYACLHDTSLSSSPTFGIIFAGDALNYINISSGNSFALRLSQDIPGNEFILPVTQSNCTVVTTRLHEIGQSGTILNPFVALLEAINAVELALGYPNIDIAGSFDRSGAFTLVLEKNDTNEEQIIVKPA